MHPRSLLLLCYCISILLQLLPDLGLQIHDVPCQLILRRARAVCCALQLVLVWVIC